MSKTKKNVVSVVVLAVLVLAALLCWKQFAPTGVAGEKTITVTVIHGDGSEKEFTIETDSETLGGAMEQAGIAEGEEGAYGIFVTTVDGETVDSAKEQWWCFQKDGENLMTGIDETMIADGEAYAAVFTEGYDSF